MSEKKKPKGNPIVVLRLTPAQLAMVDDCVARSMTTNRGEPYDRSSFIRAAIEERFAKYERARKASKKTSEKKRERKAISKKMAEML